VVVAVVELDLVVVELEVIVHQDTVLRLYKDQQKV
jgi:hypothetical protein